MVGNVVSPARFQSVRDRVSPEEWQTRVDLAACYRLADHYGWTHLIYSHISAKVPGEPDNILLLPMGFMLREVTASSLLKIDRDGKKAMESPYEIYTPGYIIHSALQYARPDITCVMHIHTVAGMALSALKCGLLPITQGAMKFYNRIGYHDYEGNPLFPSERERLAKSLGSNQALILRNHGLVTVGRTASEAFYYMYHLEKSCAAQIAAMSCNSELIVQTPEMAEKSATEGQRWEQKLNRGEESWPALLRLLDARDASYRE
jgi:ribulose-5-phosphate 4-epimerase/fuculose-1-phosphate aldolase